MGFFLGESTRFTYRLRVRWHPDRQHVFPFVVCWESGAKRRGHKGQKGSRKVESCIGVGQFGFAEVSRGGEKVDRDPFGAGKRILRGVSTRLLDHSSMHLHLCNRPYFAFPHSPQRDTPLCFEGVL